MARMTKRVEGSSAYSVSADAVQLADSICVGEAIERLAKFENFYEVLLKTQDELLADLDRMRKAEQQKTVRFRESLGQKMMNASLLSKLRAEGLE